MLKKAADNLKSSSCGTVNRDSQAKKICIVTNASVSYGPRVKKEADSLASAGYEVVVLTAHYTEQTLLLDREIAGRSNWANRATPALHSGLLPRFNRLCGAVQIRIFNKMVSRFRCCFIPELANSRVFLQQLFQAIRQGAGLYIGHNVQTLPVVYWAARMTGADCAFDAEDLHCGERPKNVHEFNLPRYIQNKYLRYCQYVVASSPGIAEVLAARYKINKPAVVYNTFPSQPAEQALKDRDGDDRNSIVSFYWFSQVVSLDRGLQDAVAAIAQMGGKAELHIRGRSDEKVCDELLQLASRLGDANSIAFHDQVPPDQLYACARRHDVGLCLENTDSENHDLCIANKLFTYMLCGLAVIATRTRGQSAVFRESPGIGFLYEQGNSQELKAIMQKLTVDPALLRKTKANALAAARQRWNWQADEQTLLSQVDRVFSTHRRQIEI